MVDLDDLVAVLRRRRAGGGEEVVRRRVRERDGGFAGGEREHVEVAELHAPRRHLVADNRREPALGSQGADGRAVVGDRVVIGRRGDLDPGRGERADAVVEQRGRVGRGHRVDVKVGRDPSARVDDALEGRVNRGGGSVADDEGLLLGGVLEPARHGGPVAAGRDRDLAVAQRGDGLERGAAERVVAPVGIGRGRDAAHDEARGDRPAALLGDVPVQSPRARLQVDGSAGVAERRPRGRGVPRSRHADAEAPRGKRRPAWLRREREAREWSARGRPGVRARRNLRLGARRRDARQAHGREGDPLRSQESDGGVPDRAVGVREPHDAPRRRAPGDDRDRVLAGVRALVEAGLRRVEAPDDPRALRAERIGLAEALARHEVACERAASFDEARSLHPGRDVAPADLLADRHRGRRIAFGRGERLDAEGAPGERHERPEAQGQVVHAALDPHDERRAGRGPDRHDVGSQVVEALVHGRLDRHERVVVARGAEVDDASAVGVDHRHLPVALEEPVAGARVDAKARQRHVTPLAHAADGSLARLRRRGRVARRDGVDGLHVGRGARAARSERRARQPEGEVPGEHGREPAPRARRGAHAAPTSPWATAPSIAGSGGSGTPIHAARSASARRDAAS